MNYQAIIGWILAYKTLSLMIETLEIRYHIFSKLFNIKPPWNACNKPNFDRRADRQMTVF